MLLPLSKCSDDVRNVMSRTFSNVGPPNIKKSVLSSFWLVQKVADLEKITTTNVEEDCLEIVNGVIKVTVLINT